MSETGRLVRLAPAVGVGSAVVAMAIAGALATGVVSDAHATTVTHTGTLDGSQGDTGGAADTTGGIGRPVPGQQPVARSNGS